MARGRGFRWREAGRRHDSGRETKLSCFPGMGKGSCVRRGAIRTGAGRYEPCARRL